jgi:hypothetical protein
LTQKNVTALYHPPYSPDTARVPQVENEVKGLHAADVAEIQEVVTDEVKKVQKEEFLAAIQKLYDHAKACTYANGVYFE